MFGVLSTGGVADAANARNGKELALRLADPATQDRAVAEVMARGSVDIPLLLSWTRKPPLVPDESALWRAMARIFGGLRVTEAIPFLIKHISLQVCQIVQTLG